MADVLFSLGQVVATPGALEALAAANQEPADLLGRHAEGFWGDVCEEDWRANEEALRHDMRLFSSYKLVDEQIIWIITEADRSATTLLLPNEY